MKLRLGYTWLNRISANKWHNLHDTVFALDREITSTPSNTSELLWLRLE